MDYAGKMAIESISFTLGGKHFVSSGDEVTRALSELIDKKITLTVPSTGNADLDQYSNNRDHSFIEEIREIASGRYEIWLGS